VELEEQTIRKIEQLTGKNVLVYECVSCLSEVSPGALDLATQLALMVGGSIPSVQFLRHISKCTLAEAVHFLNDAQQPNFE